MHTKLFRRILVPYDFSEGADRALQEAAMLARQCRGRLRVLHVLAPMPVPLNVPSHAVPDLHDFVPTQKAALERRLRRLLGSRRPPASVSVEVGPPAQRILEAAAHADSIVMGTHGRTGLPHLLLGSVAERVVRHAPIPVLTVRTPRKKRAGAPASRQAKRAA